MSDEISPDRARTTPLRRRAAASPTKNEMRSSTGSPPGGSPGSWKGLSPDLKFDVDRSDVTPSSNRLQRLSEGNSSVRKHLDFDGDKVSPPRYVKSAESTFKESPLNAIASQLESDFDSTVDLAAEQLQTLAVEVEENEVGDIISAGVVPPLIRALNRQKYPEEELAALQNLGAAQDSKGDVKRHMVECGVITAVTPFLESDQPTVSRLAVAVVLNLAIDCEERKIMLVNAGVTEKIAALMDSDDAGLVSTCVNALTSLSIGCEQRKAAIEHYGCLHLAVELLQSKKYNIKLELLGFIQSLVYCNDGRKRRLLKMDFIPIISLILADPASPPVLKETGTRLLKGLAGFSAHEAKQSPSKATPPRKADDSEPTGLVMSTISIFSNVGTTVGSWAATGARSVGVL